MPNSNDKRLTMTPLEVGKILGRAQTTIEEGLRQGKFPFGTAYKMTGKYVYIIPRKAFERWLNGEPVFCNASAIPIDIAIPKSE